uniref:Sulfotransferase domain-containing protein n=1 Tax=Strigamia maritima TaxID=126957 RepID=T1II85_STRMM
MTDVTATLVPLSDKLYKHLTHFTEAYLIGPKKFCFPKNGPLIVANIQHFKARDDDVCVVTFPKTGTTWMQEIVYLLSINLDFERAKSNIRETVLPYVDINVWEEPLDDFIEFTNNLPSPRLLKFHLCYSLLPPDVKKRCKDQEKVIKEVAAFLNLPVDKEGIKQIANHCKFDNMKHNTTVNKSDWDEMLYQKEFKFMRKGIVGNWRTEMSPELITKIDKWIFDQTIDTPDLRDILY